MHLLVAITSHGFGHAAQVAPVINALRRRAPELRLTLISSLPENFLRERIEGNFSLIPEAPDFGLVMHSALEINLDGSAAAYADLHGDWQGRVAHEAQRLLGLAPDLVLADIPYLTLAAARFADIPAVALCSLNWADIYRWYFRAREESAAVLEQMEAAYRSALAFLCPEPSMPMPFLDNRVAIGPIANTGTCKKDALRERLSIGTDEAVILVAPGGVETRFDMERWPSGRGIRWLVSDSWRVQHADVSPIGQCWMTFTDLIASCDAVLGKCGYGTVTECVVNQTPLLHIARPDWPEEQTLLDWLNAHHAGVEVDSSLLCSGEFGDLIRQAKSLCVKPCSADGAAQAAALLEQLLQGTASISQ